jgi:hypothetical protein
MGKTGSDMIIIFFGPAHSFGGGTALATGLFAP